jgi:hypothetical protein
MELSLGWQVRRESNPAVRRIDESTQRRQRGKETSEKVNDNLREFNVGDRIKVNMHRGRIVEAVVKAVVDYADGKRLQVDVGKDETALIHLWQVVEKIR